MSPTFQTGKPRPGSLGPFAAEWKSQKAEWANRPTPRPLAFPVNLF